MSTTTYIGRSVLQNGLLATLPPPDRQRVEGRMKCVLLPRSKILREFVEPERYAYFPISAVVSLQLPLGGGTMEEIALIGHEGMVGVTAAPIGESLRAREIVTTEGLAYRIAQRDLREEFAHGGAVMDLLLRYARSLLVQVIRCAICGRHHEVEQRLCRTLLLSFDRAGGEVIEATHEQIAASLGVRREGVTQAAGNLRRAGLIENRRGHIVLLDRPGLEARSCECYSLLKRERDRSVATG